MPALDLSLLRVDRNESPTVMEALFRTVDWSFIPREGEGVEILGDFEAQTVESVGYGVDGAPLVHLGRVVLDDLQVKQLRKQGWRAEQFPRGPTLRMRSRHIKSATTASTPLSMALASFES